MNYYLEKAEMFEQKQHFSQATVCLRKVIEGDSIGEYRDAIRKLGLMYLIEEATPSADRYKQTDKTSRHNGLASILNLGMRNRESTGHLKCFIRQEAFGE